MAFYAFIFTRFYGGSLNKSSVIPGIVMCVCVWPVHANMFFEYMVDIYNIKIQQGDQIDQSV